MLAAGAGGEPYGDRSVADKYSVDEDGYSLILIDLTDKQRAFLNSHIHCPLCESIVSLGIRGDSESPWIREEISCPRCVVVITVKHHLIQ